MLFSIHSQMYILHYTFSSIHFSLQIHQCKLSISHSSICTLLYILKYTLFITYSPVYSSPLYTSPVYTSPVYTLQYTLSSIPSPLYILHYTLSPRFPLYTINIFFSFPSPSRPKFIIHYLYSITV